MRKSLLLLLCLSLISFIACRKNREHTDNSQYKGEDGGGTQTGTSAEVTYESVLNGYEDVLKTLTSGEDPYVGNLDYKKITNDSDDRKKLDAFLDWAKTKSVSDDSEEKNLAHLINFCNAILIRFVLDQNPIPASIWDKNKNQMIQNALKLKVEINSEKNINELAVLRNKILRRLEVFLSDKKKHLQFFALFEARKDSVQLMKTAFEDTKLEKDLEDQEADFFSNGKSNKLINQNKSLQVADFIFDKKPVFKKDVEGDIADNLKLSAYVADIAGKTKDDSREEDIKKITEDKISKIPSNYDLNIITPKT
jgi:hypothetical protein